MPNNNPIIQKARILFSLKKYQHAVQLLHNHPELMQDEDALYRLARCYYMLKKDKEYLEAIQACLKVNPERVGALIELAKYYEDRDLDKSIEIIRSALAIDPSEAANWGMLGVLYFRNEEYQSAATTFEKYLSWYPNDPRSLNNLAACKSKMGLHAEEEKLLFNSIENNPEYAPAYCNLGVMYSDSGRYLLAEKFYRKALSLNPPSGTPVYGLACVFALKGEKNKALEYLEHSIALDPKFRTKAAIDVDFKGLLGNEAFKKIVNFN